jgi:tetratricopeptide (TPR) repeat protein
MFKYSNDANGDVAWMVYALDNEYRDYVKAIELTEKAISLERGEYLPFLIRQLAKIYGWAGFPEKEKENYDKAFKLDGDSNEYNLSLADRELSNRNYKLSIELYKKCYARDSSSSYILQQLANSYFNLGQLKESLDYVKKIEWRASGDNPSMFRGMRSIGFIYWQTGNIKEANELLDKQKRIGEESIRIDYYYKKDAPWDLAAVYAFTGERDKAYENLRIVSGFHVAPPWIVEGIKDDPMFNGIRNDLEFQTIAKEIEARYQAEHERVRKWLEENGKL